MQYFSVAAAFIVPPSVIGRRGRILKSPAQ
jgi:hypothetical protein